MTVFDQIGDKLFTVRSLVDAGFIAPTRPDKLVKVALALEVGEALIAAGLLAEKPSVGQRHVFLDPRHAADIHALIDRGETPDRLVLP